MARIRTCTCSSSTLAGHARARAPRCVRPCDDDGAEAERGPSGRLSGRFRRPGPRPSFSRPIRSLRPRPLHACTDTHTRSLGGPGAGRPPAPHHVVAGSLVLYY